MIKRIIACLLGAIAVGKLCASSTPPAEVRNAWAAMARNDIEFIARWSEDQHILAVYPDRTAFQALVLRARKQAEVDLTKVSNFTGYRQALNHFLSVFQDKHFSARFTMAQSAMQWPGFTVAFRHDHYEIIGDKGQSSYGQRITACDGETLDSWTERLAPYEDIIPNLEATHALAAPLVFRDQESPFVSRPRVCTINGKDVVLDWQPIDADSFAKVYRQVMGQPDPIDHIEPLGADGVWITMNNIAPATLDQAAAMRSVLDALPALRSKRLIVIDERNNGGGPYNWFMAFLRSLYGATYTDYYARERLKISNVYRVTPGIEAFFKGGDRGGSGVHIDTPPDGDQHGFLEAYESALVRGKEVIVTPANDRSIARPAVPGPNLVHAKVVVVTGYGCYSACIGFVDELRRIPGVVQVGTETGTDSRPGTPLSAALPSGNGSVRVPVMTRDGRLRGDNQPDRPDIAFPGDIQDTEALKAWVPEILSKEDIP